MEGWQRIKAAAKYCGVSERTFHDWFKRGLPFSRIGGCVLIRCSDLDEFLKGYQVNENVTDKLVESVFKKFG